MKTEILRHVRALWSSPYAPREINRANQRKWVAARRQLGDKWLLAQPVGRKV
jgi:hypothetical protein